jgi:site-specific recombinase XerD
VDDKAIECLRKIRRKRSEKLKKYHKFLEKSFSFDDEYNSQALNDEKERLILDIFGFSKEKIRENRDIIYEEKQSQKESKRAYLSKPMWKVYEEYKKFYSSKSKNACSRFRFLEQLRKMKILLFKCTVFSNNESTKKQESKIELMTVEDFLPFYTPRKIEKIIKNIPTLRWSKETKRQALKQFRHFLSYINEKLEGRKIRHGNIKKGLRIVKRRSTNRFLRASEAAALFEEIEKSNNVRNLLFCRLIFYCGEKISYRDLQNFQVEQFDAKTKTVSFKKYSEKILIELSDDCADLLKNYIRKKKKYVFQTKNNLPIHRNHIERFIQKHALKAGLESVAIETLQHSIFSIKQAFLYL